MSAACEADMAPSRGSSGPGDKSIAMAPRPPVEGGVLGVRLPRPAAGARHVMQSTTITLYNHTTEYLTITCSHV